MIPRVVFADYLHLDRLYLFRILIHSEILLNWLCHRRQLGLTLTPDLERRWALHFYQIFVQVRIDIESGVVPILLSDGDLARSALFGRLHYPRVANSLVGWE
jgi:hypothetical protein